MDRMTIFWAMQVVIGIVLLVGFGVNISIWFRGRVGGRTGWANWVTIARAILATIFSRRVFALAQMFVRDGLLHARVWREDKWRWITHASLFWGFGILFALSTVTGLAVEVLIPWFNVHNPLVDALADKDTGWLAFANEFFGVVILFGAALAIVRRYVVKPAQLRTQNQDTIFLAFIVVVIVTGFPLEAFRILAEHVPAERAAISFIGLPLALLIAPLNAPWEALHYWTFFLHAVIAGAFIAYVPFSKVLHVFISPLVATIDNLPSTKAIANPVRATDRFGLSAFEFRQLLELDACTRCGNCVTWCPTFTETNDEGVHPLGKIAREKAMIHAQFGLFRKQIPDGALTDFAKGVYRCTLCARCAVVCPIGFKTRDLWLAMREQLTALNQQPEAFNRLRDTVTAAHNISGDPNENRGLWSDNLPTKPEGLFGKRNAETVYFIGCVGAMFPAAYGIPQSLTQTLMRTDVDFTTLGGEEWCCGFPLLLAGMRDAAIALMRHNVETVRAMGAKRVVMTCPSCYHTWHTDYPAMLGKPLGFEVIHATQLLADLIARKRLTPGALEQKVTYHDPCDLGRTSGIFDEPRYVLQSIPGVELIEMQDHRERALCCGGGGDVEMGEPTLTAAVAKRRIGQAQATGAQVIVSACQQCKRTMAGAVRKEKVRMKVLDVTEIVWSAVNLD